jgi:hypothetical protein
VTLGWRWWRLQCLVTRAAPVIPSAQWRCDPRGGDGGVRRGPTAESTQHKVGRCNPRGGGGSVVCVRCRRSSWWRVVVECIVGVVCLDAWVRAGVRLVVAVLVVCHYQGRWSPVCWSSVGGGWPPLAPSESFAWLRPWSMMSAPCMPIFFLMASVT